MKTIAYLIGLFFFASCVRSESISVNQTSSSSQTISVTGTTVNGDLKTSWSNDFDRWSLSWGDDNGSFQTAFSEDWDNWDFTLEDVSGDIRTSFSEDWDNWTLTSSEGYNIKIRTDFSEDYDNWEIIDAANGITLDVKTGFSNDFDNWDVFYNGTHKIDMRTAFSEDWDNWDITGDLSVPKSHKAAIAFIGIFAGGLHGQGIVD